jgi:hypothetical protein
MALDSKFPNLPSELHSPKYSDHLGASRSVRLELWHPVSENHVVERSGTMSKPGSIGGVESTVSMQPSTAVAPEKFHTRQS